MYIYCSQIKEPMSKYGSLKSLPYNSNNLMLFLVSCIVKSAFLPILNLWNSYILNIFMGWLIRRYYVLLVLVLQNSSSQIVDILEIIKVIQ